MWRKQTSDADTDKEAPCRQDVEHAHGIAHPVRARGEGGEDDEDNGGEGQRVGARPVVGEEAKEQLADDDAGKSDAGDILEGRGAGVDGAVLSREDGVDRANDLFCM